jgi:predicted Zn-dependent peptidase
MVYIWSPPYRIMKQDIICFETTDATRNITIEQLRGAIERFFNPSINGLAIVGAIDRNDKLIVMEVSSGIMKVMDKAQNRKKNPINYKKVIDRIVTEDFFDETGETYSYNI